MYILNSIRQTGNGPVLQNGDQSFWYLTFFERRNSYLISKDYTLGIDIGSTTVKIALLDADRQIVFADYRRHHADIQGTLRGLVRDALAQTGDVTVHPVITGSGGLTLANHLEVPFVQEVVAVSTALEQIRQTWRSSWAARTPRSSILRTAASSSG